MAYKVKVADGTASVPGVFFESDVDNGFYRIGADNVGLSIGGTKRWDFAASGSTLTGTLTVSGAVTLQSTLAVSGASTLTGLVTASAGVLIDGGTAGTARIVKTASAGLVMRGVTGSDFDWTIQAVSGNNVIANTTGTSDLVTGGALAIGTSFSVVGAVVSLPALPTSNPGVAGRLWNDAGTVKVSAG